MAHTPHSILLLPLLLGLGICIYFGLSVEPQALLGLKLVLACAGITLVFRRFFWTWGTLAAAIVSLGFLSAQLRTEMLTSPLIHAPLFAVQVEGRVHQLVFDENAYKLILTRLTIEKLTPEQTPARIRVTIKQKLTSEMPPIGSTVRLKATLFPLPAPAAPGAFDFGRYLFFAHLGAVGFSLSAPEVVATASQPLSEMIHTFRARFASALMERMPNTGAIAAALTVGEQGSVSEDDTDAMRASGLYHILSISGLHLALAAGIVFYVVRLLLALIPNAALKLPIKKIAAVAALIAAFFYLLVAGWPVPAQRSFIMVAVVLVAVLLDRKGISMTTLAWAATFILLCLPDTLMGASFQLSFAATAAIVALYERFGHVLHGQGSGLWRKALRVVLATMLVSLAATFATAPFIITYFNQLQLLGLVANVLVTPLTSLLIMPAVVLAFLLYPLGLLAWAAYPLNLGIEGMMWVARTISALPYASIPVPSYTDWGLGLSVVGFIVLLICRNRIAYLGLACMVLAASTMALTPTPDVLISQDAKQIAVRDAGDHWVMVRGNTHSFVVDLWMKKLGQAEALMPKDGQFSDATALTCTDSDCVYTCKGARVLFMKKARATPARCTADYQIAVLSFRRLEGECEGVAHVIDKTALREGGAHAIYCGEALRMENVRQFQGNRPWVP